MTAKRRPAPRPRRTVEIRIAEGDFAGWECTAYRDFPARILTQLETKDPKAFLAVAAQLIVPGSWNFPDSDDQVAATLEDVDPLTGILVVMEALFDTIAALPNG